MHVQHALEFNLDLRQQPRTRWDLRRGPVRIRSECDIIALLLRCPPPERGPKDCVRESPPALIRIVTLHSPSVRSPGGSSQSIESGYRLAPALQGISSLATCEPEMGRYHYCANVGDHCNL